MRAVAWAEQRDHIRADWSLVQPKIVETLALMGTPLPAVDHARNPRNHRGRSHDIPLRSSAQLGGSEGMLTNADVSVSRREERRRRRSGGSGIG
jgi:hypothetical protein